MDNTVWDHSVPEQDDRQIRRTVYRGLRRVEQHFKLPMVPSDLTRMARTLFATPPGAPQ